MFLTLFLKLSPGSGFIGPWTRDHVELLTHASLSHALRPLETSEAFHKCFTQTSSMYTWKKEKNTHQVGLFKDKQRQCICLCTCACMC